MKTDNAALIVARPGHLRDAWRALLMATPHIDLVHQAEDEPTALGVVESVEPHLILLDSDMAEDGPWPLLGQIKDKHPDCKTVLLVCNLHEYAQAEAAGADVALMRGFPAEKLFQVIEELFHRQTESPGALDDVAA